MQTITCPCCLTEYDAHDSPAEYARVNKQNTMNETKHTPGPWTQGYKGKFQRHNASNIYDVNGNCIASVTGIPLHTSVEDLERSRNQSDAEGMANARLISAAPELLKLLKDCHNVLFQFPDYQEGNLCDDVKSAIAKAEGSAQ